MPTSRPDRIKAKRAKHHEDLIEKWARLGNAAELRRICRDILERPNQGFPVALRADGSIRAYVDYWNLDFPAQVESTRKTRALLARAPKVVQRLDRALRDMIDLHKLASERRHWYGKEIHDGEIKGIARRTWTRFPTLYAKTQRALEADPLGAVLRDTPADQWALPGRGNPLKRRNGGLMKALRSAGLSKVQIDDVIAALGWTLP